MTASTELTSELLDLMEHEKVIEQGLGTFIDVGNALLAIRDGKKYNAAGYATFEVYCQERWDISRAHGNRLMAAAETANALSPTGDIDEEPVPEPRSERQVRPLTKLRDEPEKAAAAWKDAVEEAEGEQPTAAQVEDAVEKVRNPRPIVKPDLGGGISHPARFSDPLLPIFAELLDGYTSVLDPFAGTGRVHELAASGHDTYGVELEPEWAEMHADTIVGDARALTYDDARFDAICTSPTYGNRLADHHNASDPQLRRSYTHDLGRPLAEGNSGAMQWGDDYRALHVAAWNEAARVLRDGGRFVLNIKDHYRSGVLQLVSPWHVATLAKIGLQYRPDLSRAVSVRSLRQGTNGELRTDHELIFVFDKAGAAS